jgi:hypothetical protein
MQANVSNRPPAPSVAAAVFTDPIAVHDAAADLKEAGFLHMSIAFSADCKHAQQTDSKARHAREACLTGEKHSLPWRIRHSFEHDLHRRGTEQMAGASHRIADSGVPYTEVDLEEALLSLGVSRERIDLVNREVGLYGSLLLVEVGDRSEEAQSILERNCGINRTDTATEH